MNDKQPSIYIDDDDFDEEAEARERYGDLIMDTEKGITPDAQPTEPKASQPAPAATLPEEAIARMPPDPLDNELYFGIYGNLFSARPINSYLQTASEGSPQRPLFGPFWQENELAIFFADTGIGKSILSVQIGESIASGVAIPPFVSDCGPRRVLLFDLEMDERQIANRYSSADGAHQYQFSDELIRIVIGPDAEKPSEHPTFTHYIAASIVEHVEYYEAKIVIIDNITWLLASARSTKDAARLMKILNYLKLTKGLSFLILAHTPKRYGASPLSLNDLHGSKMFANFADSIFAMGPSSQDPNVRYLKHLKSRQHQRKYDETNTFTMLLKKMPGIESSHPLLPDSPTPCPLVSPSPLLPLSPSSFLGFTHTGTEPERDHIGWYGSHTDPSRIEKLYKAHVLAAEGKSQRQIAQILGLSLTTINRYIAQTKSFTNPDKPG